LHRTIYALGLSSADPDHAFTPLATLEGQHIPIHFEGDALYTRQSEHAVIMCRVSPDCTSIIPLARLVDPDDVQVCLLHSAQEANLTSSTQPKPVLATYHTASHTLLFRQQSVEIFGAAPAPSDPPLPGQPTPDLHPLATHRLPFRLNSINVSPRRTGVSGAVHRAAPPLDLLVRFDSYFPWPVNMLHHFVLTPDEHGAAPYDPAPRMVRAWESGVALFVPADAALGRWGGGCAVWLDAEDGAEAAVQRVCVGMLNGEAREETEWIAAAAAETGDDLEEPANAEGLAVAELGPARWEAEPQQVAYGAPVAAQEVASAGVTAELGRQVAREGRDWLGVAVEEKEGRVAVIGEGGKVQVWDYAELA
jgi:hypothetical protein